jgi:CubicO group peptidase (beta-lactamase class C family)
MHQWRPRNKAGAVYEYNDTGVNVLALAALNIWRRPLPQVLKEKIMDPIGASNTWRWLGYDNAWVVMIAGGGHWAGIEGDNGLTLFDNFPPGIIQRNVCFMPVGSSARWYGSGTIRLQPCEAPP